MTPRSADSTSTDLVEWVAPRTRHLREDDYGTEPDPPTELSQKEVVVSLNKIGDKIDRAVMAVAAFFAVLALGLAVVSYLIGSGRVP